MMGTEDRPCTGRGKANSGVIKIVKMVRIGEHAIEVTTESKRYGRVTQVVCLFPDSALEPEPEGRRVLAAGS